MTVKKHEQLITYVSERLAMAGTLSRKDREPRKIHYNKEIRKARQGGPANLERRKIVRQGKPAIPKEHGHFRNRKHMCPKAKVVPTTSKDKTNKNQEEQNIRKARQGGPA